MNYLETKTVGEVQVAIYVNGYCQCHPERCCHWQYKFVLADGKSWFSDSYHDYKYINRAN